MSDRTDPDSRQQPPPAGQTANAPARSGQRRLAALLLILAAAGLWVIEAVAAAAWTRPSYSYVHGWVADLGNPQCGPHDGRIVCSPDYLLMNTGFVLQGVLAATAALLLAAALSGRGRIWLTVLGVAEGLGFVLFGVFHNSPSAVADGTLSAHLTGAALVILAGNGLAIAAGLQWRRFDLPAWTGRTGVVLGSVGLVSAAATYGWLAVGVAERISTYSFLLWQLILGAVLLAISRRPATR